jgi:hypothetical protein
MLELRTFMVLLLLKPLAADEALLLALVSGVPRLLPVVPWRGALLVFGPGEPPVPFTIPLPDIEPAASLPPARPAEAPPEPPDSAWASTDVLVNPVAKAKAITITFISISAR